MSEAKATKHVHEFCVDTACECGVMLSDYYCSLEAKGNALLARNKKLAEALEEIADPIGHIKKNLKQDEIINWEYAAKLSSDHHYLKRIAQIALAANKEAHGL